jgi:hypothetical protein
MANVLKWIWWRFNGYGYFCGMTAGVVGAMIIPQFVPSLAPKLVPAYLVQDVINNAIYTFPVLLVLSLAGCILGTYFGEPEDAAILKHFYKTTRPWGFWGPIRDQVMRDDPAFVPNREMLKDWVNVLVGIVWQLCLTSLPIFIVIREWHWAGSVFGTLVALSIFLKFNWYDKLSPAEAT